MRGLILRDANITDLERLFKLRNHPQIRRQSHTADEIDFNEHQAWFNRVLLDQFKIIRIAENDNNFVGVVRFELINDAYLVSWAVLPKYQGHGFGKKIVKIASQEMGDSMLRAEVKKSNLASIKIAEYVGMKLIRQTDNILFYQK